MAFEAKTSRALPIGLLVFGLLLILINQIAVWMFDYWYPKIMLSGIIMSFLGLGMTIFPPADIHIANKKRAVLETIKHTKKLSVFMWVLFLAAGIATVIWYMQYVNFL